MLARLTFLGLLPVVSGCATVGMMRELPPDAGHVARYAVSPDTLAAVATKSLQSSGLHVTDDTAPDASTRIMIAGRGMNLLSNGEYVRIRIERDPGALTAIHVVTKSGSLIEVGHRERAFVIFQNSDSELGRHGVGPWPGRRVRVVTGQSPIIGTVVRLTADQLVVNPSAGGPEQTLRRGDWESLAISRGTYSHVRAGALV